MAIPFFRRIYENQPRIPQKPRKTKTFADYLALGTAIPQALMWGLVAVPGMLALTGIPIIAIMAGIITFMVNYHRFSQYAPLMFSKVPFTLFKESDEKGRPQAEYITDPYRLALIIIFVLFLAALSAASLAFFSMTLMKSTFLFLGIKYAAALGGFSLIPVLAVLCGIGFLCNWVLFSNGASALISKKGLWHNIIYHMKQILGIVPDPSLLLPNESFKKVGRWMLLRQITRLVLVIGVLGFVFFGNYIVGIPGVVQMLHVFGVSNITPILISKFILPGLIVLGGAAFMISSVTYLMTLFMLTMNYAWQQYILPIDHQSTPPRTISQQLIRYVKAILASPLLLPLFAIRLVMRIIVLEAITARHTITSPEKISDQPLPLLHDLNTFFDRMRFNTPYAIINGILNTVFVLPLTLAAGMYIFIQHHIEMLAVLNAISGSGMAFDGDSGYVKNITGVVGYGTGALAFGLIDEHVDFLNPVDRPDNKLSTRAPPVGQKTLCTVLFDGVMAGLKPQAPAAIELQPIEVYETPRSKGCP